MLGTLTSVDHNCVEEWSNIPYSRYYKTHLHKISNLFGATCIQALTYFLIFKPWNLLSGATSIQERLIIKKRLIIARIRYFDLWMPRKATFGYKPVKHYTLLASVTEIIKRQFLQDAIDFNNCDLIYGIYCKVSPAIFSNFSLLGVTNF